jgi:hypothetical protein
MMEKRMRKVAGIEAAVPKPVLEGPADADVTLIGWGSTDGTIKEARELLAEQGISTNQLQIRWIVPLHGDTILELLKGAVCSLPAQRDQLRCRWPHPQIRRRAVYAAPHCGSGARAAGRNNDDFGANPRSDGLRPLRAFSRPFPASRSPPVGRHGYRKRLSGAPKRSLIQVTK